MLGFLVSVLHLHLLAALPDPCAGGVPGNPGLGQAQFEAAMGCTASQVGAAADAAQQAGSIVGELSKVVTNPSAAFSDFKDWFLGNFLPPDLQLWFGGTIGLPADLNNPTGNSATNATQVNQLNPFSMYQNLYQAMVGPAIAIAGMAAVGRVLKTLLDYRAPLSMLLADVLPRFFAVILLILPGPGGLSLGYMGLAWLINASMQLAHIIPGLIMHTGFASGAPANAPWLTQLTHWLLQNPAKGASFTVVAIIPLLIMLCYDLGLMIVRVLVLGFLMAIAPLCFAVLAFDTKNKVWVMFINMFGGALMTPIILGATISVSLSLANSIFLALVVGPTLAVIILFGGVWLSGKLIHELTKANHGGAMGAITALSTAIFAAPKAAGALAFVAEALGVNFPGMRFLEQLGTNAAGFPMAPRPTPPNNPPRLEPTGGAPAKPQLAELVGMPAGAQANEFNDKMFDEMAVANAAPIHDYSLANPGLSQADAAAGWFKDWLTPNEQKAMASKGLPTYVQSGADGAWAPGLLRNEGPGGRAPAAAGGPAPAAPAGPALVGNPAPGLGHPAPAAANPAPAAANPAPAQAHPRWPQPVPNIPIQLPQLPKRP